MVRLKDEAAAKCLSAWWRKIQVSSSRRQRVVHILRPLSAGYFIRNPAYERWLERDADAIAASMSLVPDTDGMPEFLETATKARSNGVSYVRIFFSRLDEFDDRSSVQRYVAEVLYPFFAAELGEAVWMVFLEDYEYSGLPLRDIDVSLYGVAGIIRNQYNDQGKLKVREFLTWWRNPWRTLKERRFILRVERFAQQYGTRIEPASLS